MSMRKKGGGGGGGGGGHGGHDGGGSLRWLLTYADVITLLLALFIFLYSVSQVDAAKFAQFSSTFANLFGIGHLPIKTDVPGAGTGLTPFPRTKREPKLPPPPPQRKRAPRAPAVEVPGEESLQQLKSRLEQALPDLVAEGRLMCTEVDDGLVLRLRDSTLFDRGSADVAPAARPILEVIGNQLRDITNPIRVEGHTDNLPVGGGRFRSNWELSGARAASVLQYFIDTAGMAPNRLSLAGYGEFRPLAPNLPGQGNPQNRRVEILILSNKAAANEPRPETEEQNPPTAETPPAAQTPQ